MNLQFNSDLGETIVRVLSNIPFWGTIIAACTVIGLGFFFQTKKIFTNDWEKILVKILVLVGLPALIFKSFMTDLTIDAFKNLAVLLILGLLFYLLISTGSRLFFLKTNRSMQDSLSMCVAFSSAVYFGLPLAQALYGAEQVDQAANMFNVGYWVFMCGYALHIVRRKVEGVGIDGKPLSAKESRKQNKFTRKDLKSLVLSPIIMTLIIGFVLWVMQLIPGINVIHVTKDGWGTIKDGDYSPTRLDALVPGVSQIMTVLAALPTPLAWLAVGSVVAKGNVKEAIKSKTAWYAVLIKNMFMPLLGLAVITLFAVIGNSSGWYTITGAAMVVIVLMQASPTATTVTSYAIMYDKEAIKASQVCTLTTIMAVVTMPIWAVIAAELATTSIFS